MSKSLSQITFDFSAETEANSVAQALMNRPKPVEPAEEEKAQLHPVPETKPASTRGRKSLKQVGIEADNVNIPDDEILFQKQYYAIGEAARMFNVNASLLRFWTNEFDIIQPRTNRKGDRYFRPQDIKNLLLIHDLLRKRKFTIEGAKDWLKKSKRSEEKFATIQSLEKIKVFLLQLKASL
jgi:DNA-binding transcriptional MerR regulator